MSACTMVLQFLLCPPTIYSRLWNGTSGSNLFDAPVPAEFWSPPTPTMTVIADAIIGRWVAMLTFLNENCCILINIQLIFGPNDPILSIPALVQTMARHWLHMMAGRRPGDKTLYEPMFIDLSTHVCATQPQWVNKRHRVKSWVKWTPYIS